MSVISLHDPSKLIPAMPVGVPACSFCHEAKPKKELISKMQNGQIEMSICFDCIKAGVSIMDKVHAEELC